MIKTRKNSVILIIVTFFLLSLLPGCGIKLVPRYPEGELPPEDTAAITEQGDTTPGTAAVNTGKLDKLVYQKFLAEIKRFMGAPYVWGGASPAGTDCSGLISSLYKRAANIELPHSTLQQAQKGKTVSLKQVRFADLLFFSDGQTKKINHVGFYIAKGKFVHASESQGVIVSSLTEAPYKSQYLGAKRIME
ncbi:MAG TPA: C40 family peptidase [bacterium]|nr:C40 family peptidase [bacterium]HPN42634.1 C40 family peptidase [bacterium]